MADEAQAKEPVVKKRRNAPKVWRTRAGEPVDYKGMKKFFRDLIAYHNGVRAWEESELVEVPDANAPLGERQLCPGKDSPVCSACGLDQMGAKNPYLDYVGPENPVATIIVDSVSKSEDDKGGLGAGDRKSVV